MDLKKVNDKIKNLLDKIPLNYQREVTEINQLIEEQDKLVRIRIKGKVPIEILTLNDNERYRANHLRRRFKEAIKRGKIRK